jgi:hypothetical protein
MRIVWFFLILPFLAFAGERYSVYDSKGSRISAFEAEWYELPEKIQQIIGSHPNKKLYISSAQKGKGSKPSARYRFKTGSYIEASRKETFAICPPDNKTEGTWISKHSVSLNAENCVSVQTPDLAGTIDVLFLGSSGRMDTVQVLVDQSYIQMGDYSHKIWVPDSSAIKAANASVPAPVSFTYKGHYESRSYSNNLIVDKTKFIMADAWHYSKIDSSVHIPYLRWQLEDEYKDVKLEESKLPYVARGVSLNGWRFANVRSKIERLDTAYHIFYKYIYNSKDMKNFIILANMTIGNTNVYNAFLALDTSASGYRTPFTEEWFFLMRAGASANYYWGDEEDSLTVSRYAWVQPSELKPVAQLLPNRFGLYDMMGIAKEGCSGYPYSAECRLLTRIKSDYYLGFRLLRKTPKLHKLEKF